MRRALWKAHLRHGASTRQSGQSQRIADKAGFIGFYTLLLIAELYLMFKYARLGPSSLSTGRYHFENETISASGQGALK